MTSRKPIRSSPIHRRDGGFTLVEVIVTLVMVGIMAVIFINYMGTALDFSWKSVELVAGEGDAEGTMERIIADYVALINSDPDNALAALMATNYGADVTMEYIVFDSSGNVVPAGGPSNTIKVSVAAPGNHLVAILTKSRKNASDPLVYF